MLKIGSHVSVSGRDMLLGASKKAKSYNANAMMIYTGAPQNTRRKDIDLLKIPEMKKYNKENQIFDVIVHAPYIINLGNTNKKETFKLAVDFLKSEIKRSETIGASCIVLHPGAHVGAGSQAGLDQIVKGLDLVLDQNTKIDIALETMAGKGSEIGVSFEELKYIKDHVKYSDKIKFCLDTCHIHDAGYDIVNDLEKVINEFDKILGLDNLAVIHINDSKNTKGSKKDRHENIGFGHIGFDPIAKIVHHPKFTEITKILETPYLNKEYAPYKEEIAMLREKKFKKDIWKEYNKNWNQLDS